MYQFIGRVLESQLFWGVIGLILAAIAVSGKLSMVASALLLAIAWVLGCVGIYKIELIRDWYIMIALWFSLGAVLAFLGAWLQPTVQIGDRPEAAAIANNQMEPALNLDVAIPGVFRMRSGLTEKVEEDGWIVYLPDVRFTNRSKTDKVSLDFTLRVKLKNSPTKKDYLILRNNDLKPLKPSQQYLLSPINIGPQETVSGNLGFLILAPVEWSVGGSDVIDHNNSILEITDYVSGRKMEVIASQLDWSIFEKSDPTTGKQ